MVQQPSKRSHRHCRSAYYTIIVKYTKVYRINNNGIKTLTCGTPETTLTSLLRQPSTIRCCDPFDRNCQYTQHRTSNTHRAELIENALMVDHMKGCTEIYLHDPSLLSTLQCTLHCTGQSQNCITGTQTFSISKLGVWKHTTVFHKSSKTNQHKGSNTIDNTGVI